MRLPFRFALFLGLAAGISAPARAAESPWRSADYLQARLAGFGTDGAAFHAALEVRLADGWHSYWRMPGDGGLAPRLDWSGSVNVADVKVDWPVPERFDTAGLYSFGYAGRVSFPLTVTAKDPGADVRLALKADIMVCDNICVPQSVEMDVDLPAGAAHDDQMWQRFSARLPAREDTDEIAIRNVVLGPDALVARIHMRGGFDKADLFIESGDLYITAPPVITPDPKDPEEAMFTVAKPDGVENLAAALKGVTVSLSAVKDGRAVQREFPF